MFHRFICLIALLLSFSVAAEQAETLFQKYQSSLYQIRLIEIASGNKSSIGSGFQISDSGLIATNYHVISDYVLNPAKYRIEFVDHQGQTGSLQALNIDVINDLAIVQADGLAEEFFPIAAEAPKKGETIYSLGNPRDLGMVVVPGTYNGLKEKSFFERIHFTGSVNPGMSGGPVINSDGQVVGINVATAGNQIGFLVPNTKLLHLIDKLQQAKPDSLKTVMHQQLVSSQQQMMGRILAHDWPKSQLGSAEIPAEFADFLPCWGGSNMNDEKNRFNTASSNCRVNEDIYISRNFQTGILEMQFQWMQSSELLSHQFYRLYQMNFGNAGPGNLMTKKHATDFRCQNDVVALPAANQTTLKAVFCTRSYKQFPDLYDVFYISANLDKRDQGLISHFTLAGVQKDQALSFLKRFMEAISWK